MHDSQSHRNDHEAEFVVKLAKYIVQQGYEKSQVTILTTYSGQLFRIKELMRGEEILNGVQATVVDNYQGEENDIIIISFVRSNAEGVIGFLKESNRVNVALSRAKKGLYAIGNYDCFMMKSTLWKNIIAELERQNAIGKALKVYCQNHPDNAIEIANAYDFRLAPEGGCLLPCDDRLACGHACPRMCHSYDREHTTLKCSKPCNKKTCDDDHRCTKTCHLGTECGKCITIVAKLLPCGHTNNIPCYKRPDSAFCKARCEKINPCTHRCSYSCGEKCDGSRCPEMLDVHSKCGHSFKVKCSIAQNEELVLLACKEPCTAILECGDKCRGTCGGCNQGRLHKPCQEKCNRILVCGHQCTDMCSSVCPPCKMSCPADCCHSKCKSKRCGEPCVPCMEPCRWKCRHFECSKLCHQPCNRPICQKPCKKRLKCGHECVSVCGEKCPKLCRICDNKKLTEIFFGDEDEPDARFLQLADCGHVFEIQGLMKWMEREEEVDAAAYENNTISIQMKKCPKCSTVVRKTRSFNTVINACLLDIEMVKSKTFGNEKDNQKTQLELVNKINNFYSEASPRLCWQFALLSKLKAALSVKFVMSQPDLLRINNCFEMWLKAVEISKRLIPKDTETAIVSFSAASQRFEQRLLRCVSFLETIQNKAQQMNDIVAELNLLDLVSECVDSFYASDRNSDAQHHFELAFQMASKTGPCTAADLAEVRKEVEQGLAKLNNSGIEGVSLQEKNMVLDAMAFRKGHWYKCPNGHIYCIGECGGAMQNAKCPECKCNIGGESHRLTEGNQVATEMDGATE